jgi:hypothetical protein
MGHHGYRVTITMVLGHYGLGSLWSRVSGHHGHRVMGHHELPSPGSRVTGLSGHPSPWVSGYHHPGLKSRVTMVTGLPSPSPSPLPGSPITLIIGSQGLHGHRVTHHPGLRSRVTPQPWSYHGGVLRLDPTSTPSLK